MSTHSPLYQTNQTFHPKENRSSHRDLGIVCAGRRSQEPRKSPDSLRSEDMYKTPLKQGFTVHNPSKARFGRGQQH